MKFGEFLFLYLVARNSGDTMTNEVLEGLKSPKCKPDLRQDVANEENKDCKTN